MATKKFTTEITLKAEKEYSCSVSDNYREMFTINQELNFGDAFINIMTSSSTKSNNTLQSAKAILLKNTSNVCAEILISVMEWKEGTAADEANSVDLGPGSATDVRSWTFLLPAGRFMWLPNNRALAYAYAGGSNFESGAYHGSGRFAKALPSALNSGNLYKAVKAPSGATYGTGTAVLVNDGDDMAITDTVMVVDDGDYFKAGDLINVGTEVCEVLSVTAQSLTVSRGLLGSTAVAIADDAPLFYFFGNEYLAFDTALCISDKMGAFKSRGAFYGYGRTATKVSEGLVPGSVAIGPFFTEGGYLDWGLTGIKANTETGLVASTTYTFHIVVDEFHANGIDGTSTEEAIAFTTDASDTSFNGSSNAVLPKIQAVLDTEYYTTSSGLRNKKVKIFIHNGDIRVQSMSNNSLTRVGIANVSGTTPFGVGAFPALASSVPDLLGTIVGGGTTDTICFGPQSSLGQETIANPVTGVDELNEKQFIVDDGNGNLLYMDRIVGKIDYDKGHHHWTVPSLPDAEFAFTLASLSAHSGGASFTSSGYNTIQEIKGRSVNRIKNTAIEAVILG